MSAPLPPLEKVIAAVTLAGQHARKIQEGIKGELKADGSIVTQADREVETMLKESLLALTPGAGFWGEEYGFSPPTEAGFWVVDPIDGTSNYAHGQPLWGVTAAYMLGGELLVGAIDLPSLGEVYSAEKGKGAFLNGVPMAKIPRGDIEPQQLVGHCEARLSQVPGSPGKMRHLGAFVIEAAYVATQGLRAMTAGRFKLYDAGASILICRELDGEVRELSGAPFNEADWQIEKRCNPIYIGPKESNFPFGPQWTF